MPCASSICSRFITLLVASPGAMVPAATAAPGTTCSGYPIRFHLSFCPTNVQAPAYEEVRGDDALIVHQTSSVSV
uniref:Putative secreted protein n=1 Tax=Anopheles darlingi TaxID=43151 RepID=A0A2M4DCJ0_ANODA